MPGRHCIKDATVVILATSWMAEGGRQCERRTLSAYIDELDDAQVARTSSRCCVIPRSELMVTPSIRRVLTRREDARRQFFLNDVVLTMLCISDR